MLSLNAGVGGSESGLFAEELARMYTRFGERRGWKSEVISQTEGPVAKGGGGLREVTIKFEPPPFTEDEQVFGLLKWERGVHRVQRVPITEQQGRVHTSTVACVVSSWLCPESASQLTTQVLPIYPDTADAPLVDPKDVKSEVMRSRGAGGQHVNKTESAVRLTHLPTGISVSMQDSRSQHQNRAWAWDILRARLSERKRQAEVEAKRASRQSQVASAGRSDKVRTYNFPQVSSSWQGS
jgi:peptide chain release factor 1